ncbi:MAG: gliding motility protein GldL [Bacteroidia bacterium]|nr:gliding motility protein GldL [Bacteroidia bacterium]
MSSNSILESKGFKNMMAKIYGLGAAVVIIGALFKIMHWKGADFMLILGLGTEALIFTISAFEPIHAEYDWSLVYPELAGMDPTEKKKEQKNMGSVSQQLDKMLADAKVGPELISSLGSGLKSLSDNVGDMASISNATLATNEYTTNIGKASKSIEQIGVASGQISESISSFSTGLSSMVNTLTSTAGDSAEFKENIGKLNKNLANLNSVYGNMLSAMGGASNAR